MASKKPVLQKYIVLPGVVIASDTERWTPGSLIELDDERAKAHIEMGNVAPLDATTPPQPDAPVLVEHKPEVIS